MSSAPTSRARATRWAVAVARANAWPRGVIDVGIHVGNPHPPAPGGLGDVEPEARLAGVDAPDQDDAAAGDEAFDDLGVRHERHRSPPPDVWLVPAAGPPRGPGAVMSRLIPQSRGRAGGGLYGTRRSHCGSPKWRAK